MKHLKRVLAVCLMAMLLLGSCVSANAGEKTSIEFYFPVQLGGSMASLLEGLAAEFESLNPDVSITPIFCGNYSDCLTKLTVALQAGNAPQLVILANPTILTLLSMDAIMPLDDFIAADGGDEFINDFYAGYMANSIFDGHIYSIPFQRSVLTMFYNKNHFREVGLDPEVPPRTMEEMAEYGAKLTKLDANGNAERWGLLVPSSGAWGFQSYCISNAAEDGWNIMSDDGTEVYFDTPENVEMLEYLKSLGGLGASPEGVISADTAPSSFIEGKASMIQTSSGNLGNINASVDFDYGICLLPIAERGASIAGGGNLYFVKSDKTSDEQYQAAWRFVRFLTEPERQAQWSVDTGYIAARKSALETDILQQYFEDVPQAKVAYEQLETCYNEIRVYEIARVGEILTSAYDAVMTDAKTAAEALADAQAECDPLLAPYKNQ